MNHRWTLAVFGFALFVVLVVQFRLLKKDPTNQRPPALLSREEFVDVARLQRRKQVAKKHGNAIERTRRSENGTTASSSSSPHYYMVFSTSCSDQQHWESYVFFYHAHRVGQPGNVTRIVSGCTDQEERDLKDFHQRYIASLSDRFRVHFTPSYSTVEKAHGKHPYKYMNKPYGLRHWMVHALGIPLPTDAKKIVVEPPALASSIVMLLDPDMILLRPLVHDFTEQEVMWVEQKPRTRVVRHGMPISQQDGYLHNQWIGLNFTHITGQPKGQYIKPPPHQEGPVHWNSGPPYLATVQDMFRIAVTWTDYAPRVLQLFPELFAEMYGFIIACVQLELPFTFVRSLVISTTETPAREGWPYIDSLPEKQVCRELPPTMNRTSKMPIGLHYCKRYMLGNQFFFSKYRIKKNIMNCEKALLKSPTIDWNYSHIDYALLPPPADLKGNKTTRIDLKPRRVKREAFMLCHMTRLVNDALRHLKQQKCGAKANLDETYLIHEDPTKL